MPDHSRTISFAIQITACAFKSKHRSPYGFGVLVLYFQPIFTPIKTMTEPEYKELFKELRRRSPIGAEALRYAYGAGFHVLPLVVRGKTPLASLVPNGLRDASNDPEQIVDWWMREPDANVGFVPGLSGLLSIDVDGPAGMASLEKLEAELGELPVRWQVRSGREVGGDHYYFRVPANLDIKNLSGWREGIDLKYKGGYMILPPSIHESGNRYRCIKGPFTRENKAAALPQNWIASLPLRTKPVTADQATSERQVERTISMSTLEQAWQLVREARYKTESRTFPLDLSFEEVKVRARGKWRRLLNYFHPGFTETVPRGDRYGTCPVCGKGWKFKLFTDFNNTGTCICYSCHEKAGDGIATLAWLLDCSQDESRSLLCNLLQTDLMK